MTKWKAMRCGKHWLKKFGIWKIKFWLKSNKSTSIVKTFCLFRFYSKIYLIFSWFFRTNLPSSFMSWETYLEKQKNNCAIMDDLILLIKGVGLHEMTSSRNSHKDRILKSVEKCLTFVPVGMLKFYYVFIYFLFFKNLWQKNHWMILL